MLKIKRVYDPVSPEDGKRILVDRLWPRGIRKEEARIDEWLRDIAPSNELRKWYSHEPSKWEEFKRRYSEELSDKGELVARLKKESRGRHVTLVFSTRELEHNNAAALKELIEKSR